MQSPAKIDLAHLYPNANETLVEYWASWSPFAPLFGIDWRVAKAFDLPDIANAADLAPGAREVAEILPASDSDALSKVIEAACADDQVTPKRKAKAKAPAPKKASKPSVAKTAPVARKASAKPKPKPAAKAEPDDLTAIKGIGPKIAKLLSAEGVTRYADIAKWRAKDIAAWDARPEVISGRIKRDDWVGQAKKLAKA